MKVMVGALFCRHKGIEMLLLVGVVVFVSEEAETFFLVQVALHFYFLLQTFWNWWAPFHMTSARKRFTCLGDFILNKRRNST